MGIMVIVLATLLPIMTISGFIVGYNINAPKKIMKLPKKQNEHKPTESEILMSRIDNAVVYKQER